MAIFLLLNQVQKSCENTSLGLGPIFKRAPEYKTGKCPRCGEKGDYIMTSEGEELCLKNCCCGVEYEEQ